MNNEAQPEWKIRLEKLAALKKAGINPYPSVTPTHITVKEANNKKEGTKAAVVGRITAIRSHGKSTFFDLFAGEEKLQLYFKYDDLGEKQYDLVSLFDHGDYIWVSGEIFTTKAGEPSLKVTEFQLLSKSLLPIPEGWHGLSDVETRYRQRTLDFKINAEARQTIRTRATIISSLRYFLEQHGFIEIQTPVLQPIPGGAMAKPFMTRYNSLEADFFLRISPELYLKRLIAGGFEQVYEIGPNFRNEGLSHMHNPEFTMCEFYWAYKTSTDLMEFTQGLIQEIVKKIAGSLKISYQRQKIDFSGKFTVIKFSESIKHETDIDIEESSSFEKLQTAIKKAGIKFENQEIKVWTELVDELFKKTVRPTIVQPTFVTDYPTSTKPLAKPHEDNPDLSQSFQLIFAGGFELVNSYSELNDPIEQEARFREQLKFRQAGWEEAQILDENFIEALKFGMPPTAGWGMGIDRLVMILTDHHSIKEVIPFPTLRPIINRKS